MPAEHDVMLAIGRLEGKLDSLLQMRQQQQQEIKELDGRVRHLEHTKAIIIGGAGAVSAAFSLLLNLFHK
jgi:prefoldin subunit 5